MDCKYQRTGLCTNSQLPTFMMCCNSRMCGRGKGDIVARRDEIYRAALDTFGAEEQRWHTVEELTEMLVALCHVRRRHDSTPHLAEEIADAQIMLEQMALLYGCAELVEQYRAQKLLYLTNKIGFEL